MKQLKVGTLIIRKDVFFEGPDFGIVTEVKDRKKNDKHITIYWFIQKKKIQYFDLDLQWFIFNGKDSLWKIFN